MDSRVAVEWTISEVEEARSLIASLNGNRHRNSSSNDDDGDEAPNAKQHNCVTENLHKLFPRKTVQEVTGLYVDLVMEGRMVQGQEKSRDGATSDMHNVVDPKSTLVSDSFGVSEEEAMADAEGLLFDYPLEEMEMATETQEAPPPVVVEEDEVVDAGMDTQEAPVVVQENGTEEAEVETLEVPVVVEKEVEVLENQANIIRRPVVPQKGMPWTAQEHSLFLQGLRVFGRGKWKSMSKHLVTTRSPVQISSHAQKYFQKMERKDATAERQRRSVVGEDGNRWMMNPEFASRAFAFAGVNYDPRLGLPPNPSFLEDLARIWSPVLYRPQASQARGEQVMVSALAAAAAAPPMEGAGSFVAAGHEASLPQPPLLHRPQASQAWSEQAMVSAAAAPTEGAGSFVAAGHGASLFQPPLLHRPQASQAWSEQAMVSAAAAPTEGAGSFVAAGHGASLPQQWMGSMY